MSTLPSQPDNRSKPFALKPLSHRPRESRFDAEDQDETPTRRADSGASEPTSTQIPIRVLTCQCSVALKEKGLAQYKGFPGTMDITLVAGPLKAFVASHSTYDSFMANILTFLRTNYRRSWQDDDTPGEAYYHLEDKHFTDYINTDVQTTNKHHKVKINIVPLTSTFAVLSGPYQWSADHIHEANTSLINPDHPHLCTPDTFKTAAAHAWEKHLLFVYIKRRAAGRPPPTKTLVENGNPEVSSRANSLRASRIAAIEAEMQRCEDELLGVGLK